ncbi:MAG: cytochrome c [Acidobacteriota bacterium]
MSTAKGIKVGVAAVALFAFVFLATHRSPAVAAMHDEGAATYKAKCAVCHGADGRGNTEMGKKLNVRDLRSAEVQKQTDAQLSAVIAKGKGKMPAFGKTLSQDIIHDLVAHIRAFAK